MTNMLSRLVITSSRRVFVGVKESPPAPLCQRGEVNSAPGRWLASSPLAHLFQRGGLNIWLARAVMAGILLVPATGRGANPPSGSLCGPEERVFFDCAVAGKKGPKQVSLCGSKNPADKGGYLQYRFGRAGALELEYPARRGDPRQAFQYSHYARPQVSRTAVGFRQDGTAYWVFDGYEGDAKPAARQQGVEVSPKGQAGKSLTLRCAGAAKSDLGSLETVLPCAKDDPLTMGDCP